MTAQEISGTKVTTNSETVINWYNTIPADRKSSTVSLLKKLGNLLFGPEPPIFSRPISICASDTSKIWIADQGRGEVLFSGISNNSRRILLGSKEKLLPSISGITNTGVDEILFTDSSTNRIYRKSGNAPYFILNDSLILQQPTGIALNPVTNEIWVIETKAHCISVLDNNGNRLRTIGKRGDEPGEFNYPTHIWIDCNGKVYVVDAMNFRIQIFDSRGSCELVFGEQGDATGYFARPKGIATDSRGNIYIADALFHSVQVFDCSGRFLYYFGSQGDKNGDFWMPNGIYIDINEFLYIADSYNSRVQVFKIEHY